MKPHKDTIKDRLYQWLYQNEGWWTRLEICAGVGQKKTSQAVRVLEALVEIDLVMKTVCTKGDNACFIYTFNDTHAEFLPF
jgi:hypothetical protein